MRGLCHTCKTLIDFVIWDEQTRQGWCEGCAAQDGMIPEIWGLGYLAATVPFKEGDRVECRTAGVVYDGNGTVEQVCTTLDHGGTAVHPTFFISIDQPAAQDSPESGWYTECCLTKVS